MNLLDAPEMNIELVMCSNIEMEPVNDFDNNASTQDPLAEMSQIEMHPPLSETSSVQIVSNNSIHSAHIQQNGRFNVKIFIVCISG